MTDLFCAESLAKYLEPFVRRAVREEPPEGEGRRDLIAVRAHPDVDAALLIELRALIEGDTEQPKLADLAEDRSKEARRKTTERLRAILEAAPERDRNLLWALVAGPGDKPARPKPQAVAESNGWVSRQFVALGMNALIAAVVVAIYLMVWPDGGTRWSPGATLLAVFALWCLSFLPCWLYIRFVGLQGGALWDEYVLNLHRLALDRPRNLPRPPVTSEFYVEWIEDGGRLHEDRLSIYRQKFDSYYGRSVSRGEITGRTGVHTDSMFPVFLLAAVLATCWAAVLWQPKLLQNPVDGWDTLKFGFLGAYFFVIQMLIRRFFQSDLRPSAYAASVVRIIVVLVLVATLHQVAAIAGSGAEAVIAFVVGIFPVAGVRALQKVAAKPLKGSLPSLSPRYPLSWLSGLNVWYEARLLEEGIEDLQNLTTANLVDVLLHTRVPVSRLVDWIDQAHLCLHFDGAEKSKREELPKDLADLRKGGIRTATELIGAYPPDRQTSTEDKEEDKRWYRLSRILSREGALNPVWNWHCRGSGRQCTDEDTLAETGVRRVPLSGTPSPPFRYPGISSRW
jgi:hypothetical protein